MYKCLRSAEQEITAYYSNTTTITITITRLVQSTVVHYLSKIKIKPQFLTQVS